MLDAAYIEQLFETPLLIAGLFSLSLWMIGKKPSNLKALYIFAGVVGVNLLITSTGSNGFLLVFLLSLIPSFEKKPKFTFPPK